jgi:hypothetical protein
MNPWPKLATAAVAVDPITPLAARTAVKAAFLINLGKSFIAKILFFLLGVYLAISHRFILVFSIDKTDAACHNHFWRIVSFRRTPHDPPILPPGGEQ